ncbi:MAG: hypothetical protein GY862_08655, partial [Gammaproteobacteria bacterium]|nr:hypothetical protein [Gammaproteobacteria bacterium]
MAAYTPFKRDDPVLFFKLRAHVRDAPREQRRYLLWPVWTYRVVAPTAEQRRLNILQKAVLGLCNAGVFEIKRVAERLDIHAALAKEIILTLQQDGLANSRGLPTDAGMKTLIDETIKISDSVSVGHVFQDPWTGELWPRFVQDLNYAELRYEDSDHPRLVLGSTGKPRYQWAYQYAPRGDTPTRPQPKQIIDAVRQHKRAKRHSVEWEYDEDNYVSYADKELQDRLERVSIVDDAPQRMFLATYLYLDEAEADWYVCDPFGFGPSLFLRRRIDEQIKEPWAGGLREQVQGILKNSLHGSLEDIEQWHEKLRYQATLQVRHKVPYLNDKAIFKALLDVEFACQKIKDMEYFEQDMRNIFREGR